MSVVVLLRWSMLMLLFQLLVVVVVVLLHNPVAQHALAELAQGVRQAPPVVLAGNSVGIPV